MTEAKAKANKKYLDSHKDKYSILTLRIKRDEKTLVVEKAKQAGKSTTQYLMECSGVR